MLEASLALGIAVAVALVAVVGTLLPWQESVILGGAVTLLGLVVSLPAGLVYNLKLRNALAARGVLPAGWIWRPTDLHRSLRSDERARVLPWFVAGALGFGVALLGCALLLMVQIE